MLKINNKNKTFSTMTDAGRYTPKALSLIADIKPERYEGTALFVPENITFDHIKVCLERFSRYLTLEMNPNNPKEAVVGVKIISYHVLPAHEYGTRTLAICDDPKELAIYLRREWCIPMNLAYSEPPKNIDELNRWVKNYGGGSNLHFIESEYGDIPNEALEEMTPVQRLRNKKYLSLRWTGDFADRSGSSHDNSGSELVDGKSKEDCYRAMAERIYNSRKYLVKPWGTHQQIQEDRFNKKYKDCGSKLTRINYYINNGAHLMGVIGKRGNDNIAQFYASTSVYDSKSIKNLIKSGKLVPINIQIDAAGRLVKKSVDLTDVCRPYDPRHPLSYDECVIIMMYGKMYFNDLPRDSSRYKNIMKYVKKTYGESIDFEDINRFVNDKSMTVQEALSTDTACRDYMLDLIYKAVFID